MPKAWKLLKASLQGMSEDKAPIMGAALAYYTVFSIAPLLVIAIGVAGLLFGQRGGENIFESISGLIGPEGGAAISAMVRGAASRPRGGWIAAIVGVATLLAGASGVFGQLQESLNIIWKVGPKPTAGFRKIVKQRLWSFGMVLVIAFLLLVSLVASAAISAVSEYLGGSVPGGEALWQAVNALVSVAIIGVLFAAIFKVLPDVRLRWRDVWVGGFFTAAMFTVGKTLIGLYLGHSGISSTYGAVGSLIVVLLWVFYSSQILLFGAEFTRAWVLRGGRPVVPAPDAELKASAFNAPLIAPAADGAPRRRLAYAGTAVAAAGAFGIGWMAGRRRARRG